MTVVVAHWPIWLHHVKVALVMVVVVAVVMVAAPGSIAGVVSTARPSCCHTLPRASNWGFVVAVAASTYFAAAVGEDFEVVGRKHMVDLDWPCMGFVVVQGTAMDWLIG